MNNNPTAFISYSWEDEEHKNWVKALATKLRNDGIDLKLDQWELTPGDQLPSFMEKSVRETDYVLIICTPSYKSKSDNRQGGVGYEGDIITSEVYHHQNNKKFIPILRKGEWNQSAPSWIMGKYYIDLREGTSTESNYTDLITTLLNIRDTAPPVGQYLKQKSSQPMSQKDDTLTDNDIKIKGILVDEVGDPLNDGTRGSALYKIPFELNKRPDYEWAELFKQIWDKPPRWTSMHRPGIGYVIGNKIILDGTTIEEVKKYHNDTLKIVVDSVNQIYNELKLKKKLERERQEQMRSNHRNNIRNISGDIEF